MKNSRHVPMSTTEAKNSASAAKYKQLSDILWKNLWIIELNMMDDIINGQSNLRNALTSCDDPLKAIEAFQVSFS